MSEPILPEPLRAKIKNLFEQGFSSVEIYDTVIEESKPHVESHEQLMKCLSSLKGKVTLKKVPKKTIHVKRFNVPKPKKFDTYKHQGIINQLRPNMPGKVFENLCEDIVIDILENYEGFKNPENANKDPNIYNPPFDFFAFKDGKPFVIEFKGSLNSYNHPGETQKRRLKELKEQVRILNMALLQVKLNQVKLNEAEYRIFYNDELNLFFDGKRISINPVAEWIKSKLSDTKVGNN
jgi:hypothetical protein